MPGQLRSRKRKNNNQSKDRKPCPSLQKSCAQRSHISCECEQRSADRRCSASPQPPPGPDKENQQDQQEAPCCGETTMDCQDYGKIFPDEDSNQILPVEHFFGNMDTVQDFPRGPPLRPLLPPELRGGDDTSLRRTARTERRESRPRSTTETETAHTRTHKQTHNSAKDCGHVTKSVD
ncbi:hypothetical protein WMY93_027223 [Mugilogobius chulae]|uniref:Uncharacterized protein n=1 Tax=Mugilogobius chulae TaxID=88201 RepID=A0AAW0MWF1_9GOBI